MIFRQHCIKNRNDSLLETTAGALEIFKIPTQCDRELKGREEAVCDYEPESCSEAKLETLLCSVFRTMGLEWSCSNTYKSGKEASRMGAYIGQSNI